MKKKATFPSYSSYLSTGYEPGSQGIFIESIYSYRCSFIPYRRNAASIRTSQPERRIPQDKGIKAALALKRLKNLRPEVTRKLFYSKVTSITDYASPISGPAAAQYTIEKLDKVQKIGAQAITGAFCTVSLLIAESEASLVPTQARLHRQVLNTWIKWHTKPLGHRF